MYEYRRRRYWELVSKKPKKDEKKALQGEPCKAWGVT